ncbi:MAG: phosphatase PAP2 family protein [Spirochaetaceae bacterium]|jgi:membrane-associated phospholipid phosphatase|nr:phosphatase PAP2 family protein [Spirochaetaceae bacterium]
MNKNTALSIVFFFVFCFYAAGQEASVKETDSKAKKPTASLTLVFHNIGWNALNSITYNYGANFIGAGLGTWALIETGLDWEWRNIAYNKVWLANSGIPFLYIGYVVPGIVPLATYITGRFVQNEKLQILGMALVQSLVLNICMQSTLKMITGRTLPGIVTHLDHTKSFRTDDFSDEFNWFDKNFIGGWPSGHTGNAFAAAAVITELYRDSLALKITAYTYAALVGLGVSVSGHWASDVFAGILMGYAIGKTVGKSYRKLLENDVKTEKLTFYATGNSFGVIISR